MKKLLFLFLLASSRLAAQSGEYLPTITALGNDTVLEVHKMKWQKFCGGNIVSFSVSFKVGWKNQNYGMVWDDFSITLPQVSDFTASGLSGEGDVTAVVTRRQSDVQTINFTPSGLAFAYCDPVNNTIIARCDPLHTTKPLFPQGRTLVTVTGHYVVKPF